MKFNLTLIGLLAATLTGSAALLTPTNPPAAVGLAWDPSPDISVVGYKIYWGPSTRSYTNQATFGNVTTCQITNLIRGGTFYFTATAFNGEGIESDFSNEVKYTPSTIPPPPTNLKGTNVLLKVSLESSKTASGPWGQFADLFASAETPAFFRSKLSVTPAASFVSFPEVKDSRKLMKLSPPVPSIQ